MEEPKEFIPWNHEPVIRLQEDNLPDYQDKNQKQDKDKNQNKNKKQGKDKLRRKRYMIIACATFGVLVLGLIIYAIWVGPKHRFIRVPKELKEALDTYCHASNTNSLKSYEECFVIPTTSGKNVYDGISMDISHLVVTVMADENADINDLRYEVVDPVEYSENDLLYANVEFTFKLNGETVVSQNRVTLDRSKAKLVEWIPLHPYEFNEVRFNDNIMNFIQRGLENDHADMLLDCSIMSVEYAMGDELLSAIYQSEYIDGFEIQLEEATHLSPVDAWKTLGIDMNCDVVSVSYSITHVVEEGPPLVSNGKDKWVVYQDEYDNYVLEQLPQFTEVINDGRDCGYVTDCLRELLDNKDKDGFASLFSDAKKGRKLYDTISKRYERGSLSYSTTIPLSIDSGSKYYQSDVVDYYGVKLTYDSSDPQETTPIEVAAVIGVKEDGSFICLTGDGNIAWAIRG